MYVDVEKIVELAKLGHKVEIKNVQHDARLCNTCIMLAIAERKVEEAEEQGSNVVLYIP